MANFSNLSLEPLLLKEFCVSLYENSEKQQLAWYSLFAVFSTNHLSLLLILFTLLRLSSDHLGLFGSLPLEVRLSFLRSSSRNDSRSSSDMPDLRSSLAGNTRLCLSSEEGSEEGWEEGWENSWVILDMAASLSAQALGGLHPQQRGCSSFSFFAPPPPPLFSMA